ncbi:MAG: PEP-CTERM sorting domain-containing protein, partial [Phycisphaera sp. TMED24]
AGGTDLSNAAFSVTNVPAPGALALLGLAGLGRRRRG